MKTVLNPKPTITPGMKIRLRDGKNVKLKGNRGSYDWTRFEIVERLDGKTILFETYPSVTWYDTDMDWEIKNDDR